MTTNHMNILFGIIQESYFLLNKMSVYLLFGFLFAGILHIFVKTDFIASHLGKSNIFSVIKAALFGIPLPLCSCGVIPAALSLRKEGASKGAVVSFLISTPTTGVDSVFATYSLLGGIFAIYRVIASFIAGVFAGILSNIFIKHEPVIKNNSVKECKTCCAEDEHTHTLGENIKGVFTYAFGDILRDAGKWLMIGILIGGTISYFIPEEFISSYLSSGWQAMVIMLLVSVPMYVCATGSIPIAAALMLKGLNPGAAFVFLLAGPATNAVTITVISKQIGVKTVVLYLTSIAISSIGLGLLLDKLWNFFNIDITSYLTGNHSFIPGTVEHIASIVLLLLVGYHMAKK